MLFTFCCCDANVIIFSFPISGVFSFIRFWTFFITYCNKNFKIYFGFKWKNFTFDVWGGDTECGDIGSVMRQLYWSKNKSRWWHFSKTYSVWSPSCTSVGWMNCYCGLSFTYCWPLAIPVSICVFRQFFPPLSW